MNKQAIDFVLLSTSSHLKFFSSGFLLTKNNGGRMKLHEEMIQIQHDLKIPNHVLCLILGLERADYKRFKRGEIKPDLHHISMFRDITRRPLHSLFPIPPDKITGYGDGQWPGYMIVT